MKKIIEIISILLLGLLVVPTQGQVEITDEYPIDTIYIDRSATNITVHYVLPDSMQGFTINNDGSGYLNIFDINEEEYINVFRFEIDNFDLKLELLDTSFIGDVPITYRFYVDNAVSEVKYSAILVSEMELKIVNLMPEQKYWVLYPELVHTFEIKFNKYTDVYRSIYLNNNINDILDDTLYINNDRIAEWYYYNFFQDGSKSSSTVEEIKIFNEKDSLIKIIPLYYLKSNSIGEEEYITINYSPEDTTLTKEWYLFYPMLVDELQIYSLDYQVFGLVEYTFFPERITGIQSFVGANVILDTVQKIVSMFYNSTAADILVDSIYLLSSNGIKAITIPVQVREDTAGTSVMDMGKSSEYEPNIYPNPCYSQPFKVEDKDNITEVSDFIYS